MEANKTINKNALGEAEELLSAINRDLLALEKVAREGNADAPVTIVMFTDFQCPACAGFYPILKQTILRFNIESWRND